MPAAMSRSRVQSLSTARRSLSAASSLARRHRLATSPENMARPDDQYSGRESNQVLIVTKLISTAFSLQKPQIPSIFITCALHNFTISFPKRKNLVGGTGDEEPLVDRWVDWSGLELLVLWEVWKLLGTDTRWGVLDGDVGKGDVSWGSLASDELLPCLSALTDDVHGVTVNLLVSQLLVLLEFVCAYALFLHSPVKANWFSGFPSGIL